MISVCLASYNGARFIREQLESILVQLGPEDELVLSDDGSTDDTLAIAASLGDPRLRMLTNTGRKGVVGNFENALKEAKGELIFLADQDDVWHPDKIRRMKETLDREKADCVQCNCRMTDARLIPQGEDLVFRGRLRMGRPAWSNWIRSSWLGCCMAFRRDILELALPFPDNIVCHDIWIGLLAQKRFRCAYLPDEALVFYRRHEGTVTYLGGKSPLSMAYRLKYRLVLLHHLLSRCWSRRGWGKQKDN